MTLAKNRARIDKNSAKNLTYGHAEYAKKAEKWHQQKKRATQLKLR